ncbi:DNA cytosine methyltransferase [Millionella massiliensis]|uniref:DNA cytosine methyltransferase n=1 Tax=Millionella massiliensis TaxID=1871023 RepID=UPI0008D8DD18|nr:DNA cytosine methyltransferase [Millionella massiliensis]
MKLMYIDLFCGAGGTSTGVENARYNDQQCAKVVACVNHDANAIASHAANHPDALHFTEDIRTLELAPLTNHLNDMRRQYPDAFVVLWASLECTNFSKAKGGQPRDADSRTLAEHLFRYIEAINPDYIQIENVEEFMSWGDLDENGKPISKDAGRLYKRWVTNVCGYGYRFAHRILNSADYGAYTTRRRFFGIFAKGCLPIVFPEPTHSKDGTLGLFGRLQRWKPVREVLDFSDEGESIFGRKKPLVDATLKRIYAGLVKFVAGGKEAFLIKYNSMSRTGKYHAPGIDEPCPTIATQGRLGVAQVNFLSKYYGGSPEGKSVSVEEPAGTITTRDHHSFITAYYGNGHNHGIDAPAPTLTTRDRLALVDMQYGNGTPYGIHNPAPTVTTNPKHHLVICRTDHYDSAIAISPNDSPTMAKIKRFMALYGIVDIKMRMLRIQELKRIMGFPADYVLVGTQADQKKFIGNAVEVNMARVLCEALCAQLIQQNLCPGKKVA